MTQGTKLPRGRFAGGTPQPITISVDKRPPPPEPVVRVTMSGGAEPVQGQPKPFDVDHVRQVLRALEKLQENLPKWPEWPERPSKELMAYNTAMRMLGVTVDHAREQLGKLEAKLGAGESCLNGDRP